MDIFPFQDNCEHFHESALIVSIEFCEGIHLVEDGFVFENFFNFRCLVNIFDDILQRKGVDFMVFG